MPDNKIAKFDGEYRFLSNFYPCAVNYGGIDYQNTEAAFQAQKTLDPTERRSFGTLSARDAKRLGRRVSLRPDWEAVKIDIMRGVLEAKFGQNPDLKAKLLATGDARLIEGNTWYDTFWGVCNGKGRNELGKLLMELRDRYRQPAVQDDETRYWLELSDGKDGTTKVSLDELEAAFCPGARIHGMSLHVEKAGTGLSASMGVLEQCYPGVAVDGHIQDSTEFWLANAELPNESFPGRFAARLYAGCARYETDSPVAIVTHECTDAARIEYRAGKYGTGREAMTKLVYVDYDTAESRPWRESDEKKMPEHREDE